MRKLLAKFLLFVIRHMLAGGWFAAKDQKQVTKIILDLRKVIDGL